MSTRKLILTALFCGIVIMLAGGFKLLQISTDDSEVSFLAAGAEATLGDMTVSVQAVEQRADATRVTVTMAGVDGADALEGWRLVASGEAVLPVVDDDSASCRVTSADAPATCVVTFPPSEGTVTVAYLRAGGRAQWSP